MRTFALAAWLFAAFAVSAADKDKVYKWTDKNGVVHYESKPHEEGAAPAKLPPLQTYPGGTTPDLSKYAKPAPPARAPGSTVVNILSPKPDETIRDAEGGIAVAVEVPGGLGERQLVYYVDGTVASGPTPSTTLSVMNVDRGSHTIAVALVDAGKEVGRSSVTVNMKPPSANHPAPPAPPKH